jgi:hypothetical protein
MAEARAEGLSFEEAWDRAIRPGKPLVMVTAKNPPVGAVRWPTDRDDRVAWQRATNEAREGWRRAYEQAEPSRPERAITLLAPLLDRMTGSVAA